MDKAGIKLNIDADNGECESLTHSNKYNILPSESSASRYWKLIRVNMSKLAKGVRRSSAARHCKHITDTLSKCASDITGFNLHSIVLFAKHIDDDATRSGNVHDNQTATTFSGVDHYPFCDEYNGRKVRKTKTFTETMLAILEEENEAKEKILRADIEKHVSEILLWCNYRFDIHDEDVLKSVDIQKKVAGVAMKRFSGGQQSNWQDDLCELFGREGAASGGNAFGEDIEDIS